MEQQQQTSGWRPIVRRASGFVAVAAWLVVGALTLILFDYDPLSDLRSTVGTDGIVALLVVLAMVGITTSVYAGYRHEWTGFGEYRYGKTDGQEIRLKKTLWDWLQLLSALAIPILLAAAGFWFSMQQDQRQQAIEDQRQQIEDQRAQLAALQAYLDEIGALMLDRDLRTSEVDSDVRQLARARTLTVLDTLSPPRKPRALEFLFEMQLIQAPSPDQKPVISLRFADLHEISLVNRDLLRGADLDRANLNRANLTNSDLSGANLTKTRLYNTRLNGIDLSGANLTNAMGVTEKRLEEQAASLEGATMPDGSPHD